MKAPTMFMSLTGTQAVQAGEIPGVLDQGQGRSGARASRVTLGWTKRGELIKFKVKADRDRSAATLGVVSYRAWTPSVVRVLLAQAGTCLRSCPCQKPSRLHRV